MSIKPITNGSEKKNTDQSTINRPCCRPCRCTDYFPNYYHWHLVQSPSICSSACLLQLFYYHPNPCIPHPHYFPCPHRFNRNPSPPLLFVLLETAIPLLALLPSNTHFPRVLFLSHFYIASLILDITHELAPIHHVSGGL